MSSNQSNHTHITAYDVTNQALNATSHGISAALAILATLALYQQAHTSLAYFAYTIYGLAMVVLFTASTVYHCFYFTPIRNQLQILDHASIFLLIAGTYTPFCLLVLNSWLGWLIFGLEWTIALVGIYMKIRHPKTIKKFSTYLYLAMGWLVLLVIWPISQRIGWSGLAWLLAGGLTYSAGTYFYSRQARRYYHFIWHLFVSLAAAFMYLAVYLHI
ncbi:hypothetical protein AWM75_07265 [Aerococcus urinaehominis]|uniref:Uncharacterized protein n=1 Tax=Aerococcus urinaehominis TaxID=128944 RepID=A0A109RH02_9LACT|nr:hemolysin III family protein [Aerococcus urinaehominis]AMB99773.1 hypothetical protein AWM75_07265 [Aerococcus urinaehominis]SDM09520.1 hemolysin III [Aerococcus urinaehominis]